MKVALETEGRDKIRWHHLTSAFLRFALDFGADTVCLRFIDPIGDATFNKYQARALVEEIEPHLGSVSDPALQEQLQFILSAAAEVADGRHLYIRFIGD